MDFRFGAGAGLYDAGLHPRIYVGPNDRSTLRTRMSRGIGKKLFDALQRRIEPYIEATADGPDEAPVDRNALSTRWSPENCLLRASADVAFAFWLTEDPRPLHALRRLFLTHAESDAANSRSIASIAVAFDLVCDHLEPTLRSTMRQRLLADARDRIAEHAPTYYSKPARNLTIDHTLPAILNLLAIRGDGDTPEVDDAVDAALTQLISFLDATMQAQLGRDGYPEEDIGYGSMEGANLALWSEPLRRAGLYDPYTSGSAYACFGRAMLHMVQPWGQFLSNTGDHGDDFRQREFVLGRLAQENGDPSLVWLLKSLTYPPSRFFSQPTPYSDFWHELELAPGEQVPASMMSLLIMDRLQHTWQAPCTDGRANTVSRAGSGDRQSAIHLARRCDAAAL